MLFYLLRILLKRETIRSVRVVWLHVIFDLQFLDVSSIIKQRKIYELKGVNKDIYLSTFISCNTPKFIRININIAKYKINHTPKMGF